MDQDDFRSLLASPLLYERIHSAVVASRESGKEWGFLVWTDMEKIVLNHVAGGEETQIKGHYQQDEEYGLEYPPDTGYYEGLGSQTLIHVHVHPGAGRNPNHRRIPETFPSISDFGALWVALKENRIIAEEFRQPFVFNPLGVVADWDENLFLYQYRAEASRFEDGWFDLVAEALNETFRSVFRRLPRDPFDGPRISWAYRLRYGIPAAFLVQSSRRYLSFVTHMHIVHAAIPLTEICDAGTQFRYIWEEPKRPETDEEDEQEGGD